MTNTAATPTATAGVAMTLQDLMDSSDSDDYYEEDATDYLWAKGVELTSHSRRLMYLRAWAHGWHPSFRPSMKELAQ